MTMRPVSGKLEDLLVQILQTADAKKVGDFFRVQPVTLQSGMDAMLQLGTQIA
jgi:hypothetical protein